MLSYVEVHGYIFDPESKRTLAEVEIVRLPTHLSKEEIKNYLRNRECGIGDALQLSIPKEGEDIYYDLYTGIRLEKGIKGLT